MAEPPRTPPHPPHQERRSRRAMSLARTSKDVLADMLKSAGLPFPELVFKWAEIVGPRLALVMVPVRYSPGRKAASGQDEGGTLVVSAPLAAAIEFQHQSPILIARINSALGRPAIARLKMERAPFRSARREPLPPAPRPLTQSESQAIASMASPIGEPDLKRALEALAGQVMRKKRPSAPG